MDLLRVTHPEEKAIPMAELVVIGSDSQCQLHLNDSTVSDRHARIERRDLGYILRDLRSPSGTFLNGTRILEAFLSPGDSIRVGQSEIVFETFNPELRSVSPLSSKNEIWDQELQAIPSLARSPFPVLLLGPSGTGKEILAQALHTCSLRDKGPFIGVNCSALTETLIESELFGHVKGSFTGAICDRKGAFESARGGTLFLDEIGDLPYGLQAKLLRALENSEIRPVGADRTTKTDVRIIAATHQNLYQKINEGLFRADLFYRLNVLNMSPPALNERMEDFEGLLYTFAKLYRVRFSFGAIQKLKAHKWPGNIRELKNLVARASALYPQTQVEDSHIERLLDRRVLSPTESTTEGSDNTGTLPVIKEIEKQMIIKRLQANRGNQRRTAQDLGMPKSTLHDRLKYYEIDPNLYKISGT